MTIYRRASYPRETPFGGNHVTGIYRTYHAKLLGRCFGKLLRFIYVFNAEISQQRKSSPKRSESTLLVLFCRQSESAVAGEWPGGGGTSSLLGTLTSQAPPSAQPGTLRLTCREGHPENREIIHPDRPHL